MGLRRGSGLSPFSWGGPVWEDTPRGGPAGSTLSGKTAPRGGGPPRRGAIERHSITRSTSTHIRVIFKMDCKHWVGTGNGVLLPYMALDPTLMRGVPLYMCWQLEIGDNGNIHWQLYVSYSRQRRMSAVSNDLYRMSSIRFHLERRRGTHAQVFFVS